MAATAVAAERTSAEEDVSRRLLDSAAELSYDPTQKQKVALTRHEVSSIMSTGIWFEMILQQMVLGDKYVTDIARSEFQFALTEIADECRHSIMFARACEKMGASTYFPTKASAELGRVFKAVASAETAYGGILVAEEVLDVMQRDWRGENLLPMVRTTSKIHVVEESRHMKFVRQEIREKIRLRGAQSGRPRVKFATVDDLVAAGKGLHRR